MLQVESLAKSFGERVLFQNVSFGIDRGEKVGLIAPNGVGKTTLMNILAGTEMPDSGKIIFENGITWAYLPQRPRLPEEGTLLDACISPFDPVAMLFKEWERAATAEDHAVMEQLLPRMEALGAWDYEQRLREILGKLGLTDTKRSVANLSGGEAKRVALAGALIGQPDLLMLDEPTNHLDLSTIEWLEGYLSRSTMGLLLVTHDRYFLDRVCNTIFELQPEGLYRYKGNYDYYLTKKAEREEADNALAARRRNLFRKEQEWMRRQPQARAGKAQARIDAFHELQAQLQKPRCTNREIALGSGDVGHIGNKIFEACHLSKRFGEKIILKDFNYIFARRDKVGVVGPNGVGKTTFIKLIMGELLPDEGYVDVGETVRFGYYKQQVPDFSPEKRVIDVVKDIAEQFSYSTDTGRQQLSASQILTLFLFSPEKQYTQVRKLSGGEIRRLYLCTVLVTMPNFLVLDEPTNDLDIVTLNILEEFLQEFNGCVLIVSHDRFFMDKVVNHLLTFEGDGTIGDFPGNYSQYREYCEMRDAEAELAVRSQKEKLVEEGRRDRTERPRKLSYKEQQELKDIESLLPELEAEQQELEQWMSSGTLSNDELVKAGERIGEIIRKIDELILRQLELEEYS